MRVSTLFIQEPPDVSILKACHAKEFKRTFNEAALIAGLAILDIKLLPDCATGILAFAISGLDTVEACLELSPAAVDKIFEGVTGGIFVSIGAPNPGGADSIEGAGTIEGDGTLAAAAAAAYRIGGRAVATGRAAGIAAVIIDAGAVEPDTVRVGVD